MADYRELTPFILKWEGGFVNDPNDSGGATNKGVTLRTLRNYRAARRLPAPSVEDLRNISDAEWTEIFLLMYWGACAADNIASQAVANLLVDWYWMSGPTAVRRVQRLVGAQPDGIIGPKSIAAINIKGEGLAQDIYDDRRRFYEEIVSRRPSQRKFLRGWFNRLNALMEL